MTDEADGQDKGRDVMTAVEFDRLLSIYGSNRSRWPSAVRARVDAVLASTTPEAVDLRQALREIRALDRLLAHAPVVSPECTNALSARIMLAARASARDDAHVIGRVVPFERRDARPTSPAKAPVAGAAVSRPGWAGWGAAAVLAASLLVGVFIGDGVQVTATLQDIADAAGLGPYVDQFVIATDEQAVASDEDVL